MKIVSGLATIFMLHRVFNPDDKKLEPNEKMKISPDFLEKFILESKLKGYKFITLDELSEVVLKGERLAKYFVMTLDDGYLDNYTHAYPLFKKHNVPFTVYITTSFPDRSAILWWYTLEDLILKHDEIELNDGVIYSCKNKEEKNILFMELRELIMEIPSEKLLESLQIMFQKYSVSWNSAVDNLAMSWQQITEMSANPSVTIGAHTVNHFMLANLSSEELIKEIMESRSIIESHISKKVEHFSYPFGARGDSGKREFSVVLDLNFKTATTTRSGNIFKAHLNHLEALPRVILSNDFTWSGFYRSSFRRFIRGRVVTV